MALCFSLPPGYRHQPGCFGFTLWLARQGKPCQQWQLELCTRSAAASWRLENVTKFIDVASSSKGPTLTHFETTSTPTVASQLRISRMLLERAYLILIPLGVIGPATVALIWIYVWSYRSTTSSPEPMAASVTDILVNGQTLFTSESAERRSNKGIESIQELEIEFGPGEKGYGIYPAAA